MTFENEPDGLAALLQGEPLQPPAALRQRVLADAAHAVASRKEPLARSLLVAAAVLIIGLISSSEADRQLGASLARPARIAANTPSWYTPPQVNPWHAFASHNAKTRTLIASLKASQDAANPDTEL